LAVNCAEAQRARAGFQAHETVAQQLGSESVLDSLDDNVSVPPGYRVQVFLSWGTPIDGASPMFDEINAVSSAEDQPMQAGKHHDDLYYFPLPRPRAFRTRYLLRQPRKHHASVHTPEQP
jgi:secreted PhoX family phosphatase